MMRRLPLIFLGVLLASCGGTPAAAPASSAAAPSNSTPAASGAAPAAAVASAASSAAATGPIKVGVILPLTGPQSSVGKDNADALKLYFSSLHDTVAGRKIELTVTDGEFKADVGLTKAKQLVENDKVAVLMGFTATPVAYAVAQYVKNAHVPMMITSNAAGEGMTTDPKFASPYLTRWTETTTELSDPAGDWSYTQGNFRKAAVVSADYAPGIQFAAMFASTFIRRGGAIVQEQYPALGTTDFGPFLAKLEPSADMIFEFLPGVDSLRFGQQYSGYATKKAQILDLVGVMTSGSNLDQMKDKAVGVVGVDLFNEASDDPGTKEFVKAWQAGFPGRYLSHDAAHGWASGQILASAIDKVGGKVEDTQAFLTALKGVSIDTAKGPVKLDKDDDIVQNMYVYRVAKQGSDFVKTPIYTYHDITDTWARSAEEISKFPFDKLKGKWAGMTKSDVDQALK
jgi:branched-chain amino acid transport system substrate-binding protein